MRTPVRAQIGQFGDAWHHTSFQISFECRQKCCCLPMDNGELYVDESSCLIHVTQTQLVSPSGRPRPHVFAAGVASRPNSATPPDHKLSLVWTASKREVAGGRCWRGRMCLSATPRGCTALVCTTPSGVINPGSRSAAVLAPTAGRGGVRSPGQRGRRRRRGGGDDAGAAATTRGRWRRRGFGGDDVRAAARRRLPLPRLPSLALTPLWLSRWYAAIPAAVAAATALAAGLWQAASLQAAFA